MNNSILDPNSLLGKEIHNVIHQKVDNHKGLTVEVTIGRLLNYASVESVRVTKLEINEGGTGVVVNKDTDNIQIPYDQMHLDPNASSTYYSEMGDAHAIACQFNKANLDRSVELVAEAKAASEFLSSLLELNIEQ